MAGHGWVTPNADGSVARCGGPRLCRECALEAAAKCAEAADENERLRALVRELAEALMPFASHHKAVWGSTEESRYATKAILAFEKAKEV